MKKLLFSILIPLLLLPPGIFAALPTTVVWEVEHAGADTNGGGFDNGVAIPGDDYSQQAAAQVAFTDLIVGVTTTQVTSILHPFATCTAGVGYCGNLITITGGSGCTTGTFDIISTSTITATLDRSAGTAASVCTGNLGGALETMAGLTAAMIAATNTLPQVAWIKADATYPLTSELSLLNSGSGPGRTIISGYTTTRGDNGRITIQAQAGFAGDTMTAFSNGPNGLTFQNAILDCNNVSGIGALTWKTSFGSQAFSVARNILASNCTTFGFRWNIAGVCDTCTTTNTPTSTNNAAFVDGNNVDIFCINCSALGSTANGAYGFRFLVSGFLLNPIVANFSGTGTIAFEFETPQIPQMTVIGASVYGVTSDAFRFNIASGAQGLPLTIRNSVMSNVGGYCFHQTNTMIFPAYSGVSNYNFCDTTGTLGFYSNWPAGVSDVTLSASPFVSGSTNNLALNATTGGGALVKGAGFPGVLPDGGGTGHLDGGALQSGGSSATAIVVPIQ